MFVKNALIIDTVMDSYTRDKIIHNHSLVIMLGLLIVKETQDTWFIVKNRYTGVTGIYSTESINKILEDIERYI